MRILIIILISLVSCQSAFSIKGDAQGGVSFSTFSGWGLDYQYKINPSFAVKITGFAYYFGESPPDDVNKHFNYGLQIQYKLLRKGHHRIYTFLGYNHWNIQKRYTTKYFDQAIEKTRKHIIEKFLDNYSFGIAYEYRILQPLSIAIELGYQFQNIFDKFDKFEPVNRIDIYKLISPNGGEKYRGLGFGIAFRYNF